MKRLALMSLFFLLILLLISGCGGSGASGSGNSQPSPDGIHALDNWHWRNSLPQVNALNSIVFGNGIFVSVGDAGTILTSPDGANWTVRASVTRNPLLGIAYGNGLFVAIGDGIYTSSDGVAWAAVGVDGGLGSTDYLRGVTYGNGLFVAVGGGGGYPSFHRDIFTSKDGVTWTFRSIDISQDIGGGDLLCVGYGNGLFVAVGQDGISFTSQDGTNWTSRPLAPISSFSPPEAYDAITFGNGTFVLVRNSVGGGPHFELLHFEISISKDGIIWTSQFSGDNSLFQAVTYGNGTFVAGGFSGAILSSPDGVSWAARSTQGNSKGNSIIGLAYGNGTFVAVGEGGMILQSDPVTP